MTKNVTVVLGLNFGDEGKGTTIFKLSQDQDIIVKCQGGSNSGHTVYVNNEKYIFNLLPSGILSKHTINILGNGVVINLKKLKAEIENLEKRGITVKDRLLISNRAHLLLEKHIEQDILEESKKKNSIGTTKQGIGPCYSDKINRCGIRLGNLKECKYTSKDLKEYFYPLIKDTVSYLHENKDKKILLEGCQGTLLDVDFGTFPYVTSSNCITSGLLIGCGLTHKNINTVYGVLKSYTTRVGKGPFITEVFGETLEKFFTFGKEIGSTTKRHRRCGWLDLVGAKYAIMINGVDYLILSKIDILVNFESILVCIDYILDGKSINFPSNVKDFERIIPIYKKFKGFKTIESKECKNYINFIQDFLNVKIKYLGTGVHEKDYIKLF